MRTDVSADGQQRRQLIPISLTICLVHHLNFPVRENENMFTKTKVDMFI